jgi:hypothetical protein
MSPGRLQEDIVPPGKDQDHAVFSIRATMVRPPLKVTTPPRLLVNGRNVMPAHLRVYPVSRDSAAAAEQEPSVHISLGELLPLVAIAHRKNYVWLQDFLDDEVAISTDLYEVLRAFRCHRPA